MKNQVPKPQTVEAKKAESQRPFNGEKILTDPNLASMFRERANTTIGDFQVLSASGISFSPFLEIGAGSVQRSAALINTYPVDGVATDISRQSLKDAPFILSLLNFDRLPLLICCDAHSLPFLPNTFQSVFAYQSLHHFENPIPVIAECYRVLAKDGNFFFNEEPVDSPLRRFFRRNRLLSHPPTKIQRIAYRLHVEKVFWDDGALERSLGMTEARFDMPLWRKSLTPFGEVDLEVNRRLKFKTDLYNPILSTLAANLIGGNIKGLCRKTEGKPLEGDFRQRLMCLECHSTKLLSENEELRCADCGRTYPILDDIILMLPNDLEMQLSK